MINRVFLLVVDGLGAGAADDAAEYDDAAAHTIAHLAESVGGINLPTLESLGLGHVTEIPGVRSMAQPIGCFGRLGFKSKGVDSLSGYWEMAGCLLDAGGGGATDICTEVASILDQTIGRKVLGGQLSSGTEALAAWGKDHLASGSPIMWSDGRQTCHLAAHDSIWPPEELYQRCREARKALKKAGGIGRIVAHPLVVDSGTLRFGKARRDFAGEPSGATMLDVLNRAGQILIGIGKVSDLFGGRGLTRSVTTSSWAEAIDEVSSLFNRVPRGLIFAGMDFMGPDAKQSAATLHDLDRRLPELLDQLKPGDLFVITSDHGRDPDKVHGVPTREYVPLLITGPKLAQGVNFGIRASAADVGQTIVEALQGESLAIGESFLDALRPG